jgi:secreted PhoX family phosphatase
VTNTTTTPIGRRSFLAGAGAASAGAVVAGATGLGFDVLGGVPAGASPAGGDRGRHPRPVDLTLVPVADEATGLELIKLPAGFRYTTYGWTGDPMDDGRPTPSAHDGMAAFREPGSRRVRLVRNHEQGTPTRPGATA